MPRLTIKIFYIISIVFIDGCNHNFSKQIVRNENGTISHYSVDKDSLRQGEAITYYPSGRILTQTYYENDNIIDSIYQFRDNDLQQLKSVKFLKKNGQLFYKDFYVNGNTRQVGYYDINDRRIGKWKNYKENGDLNFIKEYRIIKGKEWTNQTWEFLSTGDTLNTGTSMQYKVSDTVIKLGDSIKFEFTPVVMQHPRGGSSFIVVIPEDFQTENFTYDFSNMPQDPKEDPSFQIIKSLKYAKGFEREKKALDSTDLYKTVMFYLIPNQIGKDTLRGYFDEVKKLTSREAKLQKLEPDEVIDKGGFYYLEHRKIYFDIPIEIVP